MWEEPSELSGFRSFGKWTVSPKDGMIDKVVCISLRERPDRFEAMKQWALEQQVPLLFFRPKKLSENPVLGCYQSHRAVIERATKEGWKNVMVLEDDIYLLRPLRELPAAFPEQEAWHFLYLGAIPIQYHRYAKDWVVFDGWAAHAYVIHHDAYSLVLDDAEQTLPVDRLYHDLACAHHKSFIPVPTFVGQKSDQSDIDGRVKWGNRQWEDLSQGKMVYL